MAASLQEGMSVTLNYSTFQIRNENGRRSATIQLLSKEETAGLLDDPSVHGVCVRVLPVVYLVRACNMEDQYSYLLVLICRVFRARVHCTVILDIDI